MSNRIKFFKLDPEGVIPRYATNGASGMDLQALEGGVVEANGGRLLVKTGVGIALDKDGVLEAQVRPRSGLAYKHGITVLNAPGTIDPDYRGDIGVILINHGKKDFKFDKHDRIAQLVIAEFIKADIVEINEEDSLGTQRGTKGFGSTGK